MDILEATKVHVSGGLLGAAKSGHTKLNVSQNAQGKKPSLRFYLFLKKTLVVNYWEAMANPPRPLQKVVRKI